MDRKSNTSNRFSIAINLQNNVLHDCVAYVLLQENIFVYFNMAAVRHLDFFQTDRKNNIINRLYNLVNLQNDVLHNYIAHTVWLFNIFSILMWRLAAILNSHHCIAKITSLIDSASP